MKISILLSINVSTTSFRRHMPAGRGLQKGAVSITINIWYHFTVDWYHHSMRALPFSIILGLVVFRKDFACIVLVWHYTTDVFMSYQAADVTLWRHFRARVTLRLHATSVRRQLQTAFLSRKILLIPSFKWHFKPFSRCKLCLHPVLYPINALRQAELTTND